MSNEGDRTRLVSSVGSSYRSTGTINAQIVNSTDDLAADEENALKKQWRELTSGKHRLSMVLLYSCIAGMGACLNGFSLGYSSLAQLYLTNKINTLATPSDTDFKYIGGILNIGALLAALITGFFSDKFGRKAVLVLASIPSVFGWFLIASSWYFIKGENALPVFLLLLGGRFLTGFSIGCFSLVVPVYIIEISPSALKGLFGSINQLSITIGILIIYLLTTWVSYHYVALAAMGFTVLFVLCIQLLPETPRWLIANHERLKANAVLNRLRGPKANIVQEMNLLEKGLESEAELSITEKFKLLGRKSSLIPLFIALALMFFQQFCGINVVIFYAGSVLQDAKLPDPSLSADLGVGVIQVIVTFISVLLVDMLGRRILLTFGGFLLSISALVLGVYYFLQEKHPVNSPDFAYLAVVCLAIFIIGFSIGWGPIPWVMMGELAPLQIRGLLGGIATAVNWSFSAIITVGFDPYKHAVHPFGAWWTFGVISAVSIAFVFVFLPETRGKNLEDIQEYFEKRYGGPSSKKEEKEDSWKGKDEINT